MLKPLNETQQLIHDVNAEARATDAFREPGVREAAVQITATVILQRLHQKTGLTGRALIARAVREIEAGHVYA